MFNDNRTFEELSVEIERESSLSIDYVVLTILSAVIASFGLLLNSAAVIIGAMILAPLMSPILAISFSGLIYRRDLLMRSGLTILLGVILACLVSLIIGSLFADIGTTSEILARTKPNIMDLFVALAAGFLGGYVKIRRPLAVAIPGVAISISLMPPLCTTGIGLSLGLPNIYVGAALLFVTNLVCIVLSGLFAFWFVDFKYLEKNWKALLWPAATSLLLAIPLLFNFWTLAEEGKLKRELNFLLKSKTYTFQAIDISKIEVDSFQRPIMVSITVNTTHLDLSQKQAHMVKEYLAKKIGKPINLIVNMSPIIQVTDFEPEKSKKSDTFPSRR